MTRADDGGAAPAGGSVQEGLQGVPTGGIGVAEPPVLPCIDGQVLSEYLDGTLDDDRRQAVAQHVEACARCQRQLASLRATIKVLEQLPAPKAPPKRLARVLDEARREAERGTDA